MTETHEEWLNRLDEGAQAMREALDTELARDALQTHVLDITLHTEQTDSTTNPEE